MVVQSSQLKASIDILFSVSLTSIRKSCCLNLRKWTREFFLLFVPVKELFFSKKIAHYIYVSTKNNFDDKLLKTCG